MRPINVTTEILDVAQARQRLPAVREHLAALMDLTVRIRILQDQHADRARWASEAREERDRLMAAWRSRLECMNELGASLKDAELGLVDFYAWNGNEMVFLCFRHGEDDIGYWHGLSEGFGGRKPLRDGQF